MSINWMAPRIIRLELTPTKVVVARIRACAVVAGASLRFLQNAQYDQERLAWRRVAGLQSICRQSLAELYAIV